MTNGRKPHKTIITTLTAMSCLVIIAAFFCFLSAKSHISQNGVIFSYNGSPTWRFTDYGSTGRLALETKPSSCVDVIQYAAGSIDTNKAIPDAKEFLIDNNSGKKVSDIGRPSNNLHTSSGNVRYSMELFEIDTKSNPYFALGYANVNNGYIQITTNCDSLQDLKDAVSAVNDITFRYNESALHKELSEAHYFDYKDAAGWWHSLLNSDIVSAYSPDGACSVNLLLKDHTTADDQLSQYISSIEAIGGKVVRRGQAIYSLKTSGGMVNFPMFFTETTQQPAGGGFSHQAIGVIDYNQKSVVVTFMCRNYNQLPKMSSGLAGFSLKT